MTKRLGGLATGFELAELVEYGDKPSLGLIRMNIRQIKRQGRRTSRSRKTAIDPIPPSINSQEEGSGTAGVKLLVVGSVAAVPEPATYALFALELCIVAGYEQRRYPAF